MGYDPNTSPPRRWFAGRTYLEKAKQCVDAKASTTTICFRDLIDLFEAKLNVLRGFRAAFLLAPDNNKTLDGMLAELKPQMTEAGFQKLATIFQTKYKVSYGGTGQYSVPNFDLVHRETQERCAATQASSPVFEKLLRQAFDERVAHIQILFACAIDLFFEEIYCQDKKRDMFAGIPEDWPEPQEAYRMIARHGLADSPEDAERKYPNYVDGKDEKITRMFHDYVIAHYRSEHDADFFWKSRETDSIYHGVND